MNTRKPKKRIKKRLGRLTRPIRHALTVPILQTLCWTAQRLSHRSILTLGRLLGNCSWLISGSNRRLAVRQLLEAGVATNEAQAREISRQVFQSIITNMLEWLHALKWDVETYRQHVWFDRPEVIKEALDRGKGLIMVSGHMGNWELMVRSFSAWFDAPTASLMAETRNYRFNEWLIKKREMSGSKLLPIRAAVIGMIRYLKKGGILAMLADQDSTRNRGEFVDFFGKPAYTPMGMGHLAYRTGVPVVPVTITRLAEDPMCHVIHVGDPIVVDPQLERDAAARKVTEDYTAYMEDRIRKAPGQWVWIHDRWRHQPGQKIKVRS